MKTTLLLVVLLALGLIILRCESGCGPAINQWAIVPATGSSPGPIGAPGYGVYDGVMFIFAGIVEDYDVPPSQFFTDNLFAFDTHDSSWSLLSTGAGPSPRAFVQAAVDVINQRFLVYGGVTYNADLSNIVIYSDFWSYSLNAMTWSPVATQGTANPGPRGEGAMVYQSGVVYLFSGIINAFATTPNDLWTFDVTANTWTQIIPAGAPGSPVGRSAFALSPSLLNNALLLYGGETLNPNIFEFDTLNDTWIYNIDSNRWTEVTPSSPNNNISPPVNNFGSYAVVGNKWLLYGGEQDVDPLDCPGFVFPQGPTNNTWIFSIRSANHYTQVQTGSHTPPPLKRQVAVAVDDCIYMFGGFDVPNCTVRTVYNTDVWTIRVP